MQRRVPTLLSLVASVAGAAFAASNLWAASAAPAQTAQDFPGGSHYAIGCSISHRSNNDPIVFPGQPGRSHNHTFIGNTTVDAYATPASLRGGPTSCSDPGDSSGYWVPTLYVGRKAVLPHAALVFYVKRARGELATLPRGLVMIAGNAAAHHPQPKSIVAWSCGDTIGSGARFSSVPSCTGHDWLQLQITFPSCWNGRSTDSVDHKRHMTYLSRGRCRASHPVALPTLILVLLYRPVPAGAQVVTGHFAAHADFMNGWNANVLTRISNAGVTVPDRGSGTGSG